MSNICSIASATSWPRDAIPIAHSGDRFSVMGVTEPFPPLCPITGLPASRRIQQVSGALLIALWRASLGVSTARLLRDVKRFGLWESPCGLAFFHPMIVGETSNSTAISIAASAKAVLG